jgi:phosphate/sulfate permease
LCDILDITSFGDTNYKRMAGLLDGKFSISGNVYTGDTTGQALLIAGNTVFVGIYPSGTAVAGTQVQCIVQSHDLTMPVAGKQTFSTVFSPIAAPVALPAQS